ncbi:DEAD/DEAH box helicase [Uliginosibacterium sp. 31-16]|uniref:DEAD/DEAH box helicase n=1 Tax=Uliginosibacterium sp. 31-16 TaxID=3068315 RepID=UPI00273D3E02|nr:DEAD/DEAH box helicase [Uliginosibacterium sp. 31-16]MDP5241093.1 DEAD/DEAH box helicase [Uliginosibacterium sp. 31-16]
MQFTELALIEPLMRSLEVLGYTTPTPVQAQAIPFVLAGRDIMAAAQTGTGKTAAFALPLLQRLAEQSTPVGPGAVRVLVLVPTRELAEQVFDSFCDYGHFLPLNYVVAYGGVGIGPQVTRLRRGADVLVATPGRLLDLLWQKAVRFDEVQTLVLDEADRMLDLGFSRELDQVFAALTRRRQTLLFSATFSDAIRALAGKLLHSPERIEVSPRNSTVQGVKQWLVTCDKKRKTELFSHLLKKHRWGQALIFVRTRNGVDALLETLQHQGFRADAIHGDKAQVERLRALNRFKSGEVQLLVATDVAARGLDIDDLPLVVNFDLPTVAEDYVHRIGRTGRAGASGMAMSLVCADEVGQLRDIEALIRQTIKRIEEPGFLPEHRVPQTAPEGQQAKPVRRPKKPQTPGAAVPARKPPRQGRSGARAAAKQTPSGKSAGKAPGKRPAKATGKPRGR